MTAALTPPKTPMRTAKVILDEAVAAMQLAEANLRELSQVHDVRDPIEKHQNTTGRDFLRYANDVRSARYSAVNTYACGEQWKAEAQRWASDVLADGVAS